LGIPNDSLAGRKGIVMKPQVDRPGTGLQNSDRWEDIKTFNLSNANALSLILELVQTKPAKF
jgi:hypothetical protein